MTYFSVGALFHVTLVTTLSGASSFLLIMSPTTEIYTLSLHDALPISAATTAATAPSPSRRPGWAARPTWGPSRDRKSTRLNSSHSQISYAVFCLKKKHAGHDVVRRQLLLVAHVADGDHVVLVGRLDDA